MEEAIDLSMDMDDNDLMSDKQQQQRPSSPHNTKETAIVIDSSDDDDNDNDIDNNSNNNGNNDEGQFKKKQPLLIDSDDEKEFPGLRAAMMSSIGSGAITRRRKTSLDSLRKMRRFRGNKSFAGSRSADPLDSAVSAYFGRKPNATGTIGNLSRGPALSAFLDVRKKKAAAAGGAGMSPSGVDEAASNDVEGSAVSVAMAGAGAAISMQKRREDPFDAMVASITQHGSSQSASGYARKVSLSPDNLTTANGTANTLNSGTDALRHAALMRSIHSSKPYGCNHCDERFYTMGKMKSHASKCKQQKKKSASKGTKTVQDAYNYLDQIKRAHLGQPHIYNSFLDIMKHFKAEQVDTVGVIRRVQALFHGKKELMMGMNVFLPDGYEVEMRGGEAVFVGPGLSNDGTSQNKRSSDNSSKPKAQDAFLYLDKVKRAFPGQPNIYTEFTKMLKQLKGQQVDIIDVISRVRKLFRGKKELMMGMNVFLPDGYIVEMRGGEAVFVGPGLLEDTANGTANSNSVWNSASFNAATNSTATNFAANYTSNLTSTNNSSNDDTFDMMHHAALMRNINAAKPFGCHHCEERFYTARKLRRHEKKCQKEKLRMLQMKVKAEKNKGKVKAERSNQQQPKEISKEKEEGDDVEEAEEITYTSYKPKKLSYGKDHPDPVVENSTLSAVLPPDVTYNLAMPASILSEGKLSNLQLEAIVYGCQRHMVDLPKEDRKRNVFEDNGGDGGMEVEERALRAGFLLGDGAGMGKGRTLAGFVVENIARGRKKHVWISVSSDLYEDAKRDLRDLGLASYADENCYNLGKLPYGDLTDTHPEGVMFATYQTLISKNREKETRLDQLIDWCGGEDFEGLIMLDECHKAKTIELDADGNPKTVGRGVDKREKSSQTATKVVHLQQALPRARVVYCSATSVSHPKNLGFMSRLGLWGYGTEHPMGFNQFLEGLKRLGTGAMELHAMHLKSIGALCARTLSYESCEFELVDGVSDTKVRALYNQASEIWTDLHAQLADRCKKLNKREEMEEKIAKWRDLMGDEDDDQPLSEEMRKHLDLHRDSDSESDDDVEDAKLVEERRLRRMYRDRQAKFLRGLFWSAHQRFFRSLCIASKVDKAISMAKKALEDGHCCVIGLQSTGEARSKGAAAAAGYNDDSGGQFDEFVSAPNEDLKRIIMMMFPLPPKPKGVIAPVFLNPVKDKDGSDSSDNCGIPEEETQGDHFFTTDDASEEEEETQGRRRSGRNQKSNESKKKRRKISRSSSKSNRTKGIQWDEIPLDLDVDESVENERMVNYRKAAEKIKFYLDAVDQLELPANPLDRLLNELGGPDKVAELTGRKIRQVRRFDKSKGRMVVSYEKRKGKGRFDQINIEERNNFQSGEKLIAILSEAASTGISLQADKRVKNQRRRVHITMELPWSADKAIQQLGRTHRANQTSGPLYKFLISDVGGEKRFAAAVAKRLALLGALTQGDRRATGQSNALGLGGFDMDNKFGKKALRQMLKDVWACSSSSLTDAEDSHVFEAVKLIDTHLGEVLQEDGDWQSNLAPYEDDSRSEQTFYRMMQFLLLGPCLQLAEKRVKAIREGKSVAKYYESLADGTETKETIKPKIDEEVEAAKEAGLNFNVLCNIWLFDVGVTEESASGSTARRGKPIDVPKFLNRCLGMNLKRQKLMTDHFLKHLEKEISLAKREGNYDQGIKTVSGHSVTIHKPRSFCFRGLQAKDERVLLYKVVTDKGMDSETALKLYEEAKSCDDETGNGSDDTNGTGGWFGGGQGRRIESGFYMDRRQDIFKEVPRIFLIINQGKMSSRCVIVRPNEGKKIYHREWVWNKLLHGACQLSRCTDIDQALKTWDREFKLADRPASERYQRYCYGRHQDSIVFSGSIVPILNKILVSSNPSGDMNDFFSMPSIVRIEQTSNSQEPQADLQIEVANEGSEGDKVDAETSSSDDDACTEAPTVGDMVAHETLGSCIFRGIITEYKEDGGGMYNIRLSDGGTIGMNSAEVKNAKVLFETEMKKLVDEAKLPKVNALSIDVNSAENSAAQRITRRPVLEEGEDKDTEEYERIFEEEYAGEVPNILVGLEFPKRYLNWYSEKEREHIPIPFWEFVLRKLAERLLEEGTAVPFRELLNLERAEQIGKRGKFGTVH